MPDPPCCPECGTFLERHQLLLDAHEDLQRELIASRAKVTRLTKDRNDKRLKDPFYEQAEEVFDYWVLVLAPKAREFSGQRLVAVLSRLRAGHSVDDLKKAIDGCAKRPYVTDSGRKATGTKDQRNVELELICRNEANLHRFMAYADAPGSDQPKLEPSRVPTLGQKLDPREEPGAHNPTPLNRIGLTLELEYGLDLVHRRYRGAVLRSVTAPCPLHPTPYAGGSGLLVTAEDEGMSPSFTCGRDCLPTRIAERLRELEARQVKDRIAPPGFRRLLLGMAAMRWQFLVDRQVQEQRPDLLEAEDRAALVTGA